MKKEEIVTKTNYYEKFRPEHFKALGVLNPISGHKWSIRLYDDEVKRIAPLISKEEIIPEGNAVFHCQRMNEEAVRELFGGLEKRGLCIAKTIVYQNHTERAEVYLYVPHVKKFIAALQQQDKALKEEQISALKKLTGIAFKNDDSGQGVISTIPHTNIDSESSTKLQILESLGIVQSNLTTPKQSTHHELHVRVTCDHARLMAYKEAAIGMEEVRRESKLIASPKLDGKIKEKNIEGPFV